MPTDTPTKGLRVRNSGSGGNGLNSGLPCTFAAGSASARRVRRHVLGDVGGRIFSGKALVPNIGLRFTDNSISTPASRIRMTTLRNSGERPELRLLIEATFAIGIKHASFLFWKGDPEPSNFPVWNEFRKGRSRLNWVSTPKSRQVAEWKSSHGQVSPNSLSGKRSL